MLHFGLKGFFFFLMFWFFSFSFQWENENKINLSQVTLAASGHPYNVFPQIFQFSLQTEKPFVGTAYFGSLLSFLLFKSVLRQRKMGILFHQVMLTKNQSI